MTDKARMDINKSVIIWLKLGDYNKSQLVKYMVNDVPFSSRNGDAENNIITG